MEKTLLNNAEDLLNVISQFGTEWEEEIKEEVSEYPCVLVSFFANDIEYGEMYQFTAVKVKDFH